MRHDRPTLRGRFAALDAHLRTPTAVRTLGFVVAGLLAVQGAVVLEHTGVGLDAPEIAAVAPPEPEPSTAPGVPDLRSAAVTAPLSATDGTSGATVAPDLAPPPAPARRSSTDGSSAGTGRANASAQAPAAAPDPARQRFESRFPAHARAGQRTTKPATTRWAVLIGVNQHSGRTRDNVGSRQDAEELAQHLRSLGWAKDHVLLLTDATATRENIVEAFRWLQRKSTKDSVVVVHYSGHVKQWHGRDADGDGEVTDEAFWPSDNKFITDREIGDLLGRVHAQRLWFNVGGCEAAGFNDWGITGPNRIATWSSGEYQKSYEDPRRSNSVWGWFMIHEGFLAGLADANRDGNVTVEEAFRYATPRADQRTRGQSHGRQTPEVSDRYKGEFDLRIPPPPKPRSSGSSSGGGDDGPLCLLCRGTSAAAPRWR